MRNKTFPDNIKKQGWDRMNDLLNKELPQQRNRKRILAFFLIFGIISTLGLYMMKNYNSDEVGIGTLKNEKSEVQKTTTVNNYASEKTTRKTNIKSEDLNVMHSKSGRSNYTPNPVKNTRYKSIKTEAMSSTKNFKANEKEGINLTEIANIKKETPGSENDDISRLFTLKTPKFSEQKDPFLNSTAIKISQKSFNWYFHPFLETKVFNTTIESIAPKFEFSAGNSFYFNRRFFFDIAIGYTNSQLLVSSVNLAADDPDSKATNNEIELYNNRGLNQKSIKHGVFEISLHEGYRVTRKVALKAGGGISFTKVLNSVLTENTGKFISNDNGIEINDSEFGSVSLPTGYLIPDHTYFADLNLQYQIINRINLEIGYKYYFNNYNVLTDIQQENVYRAYIKQPMVISNFYLGLKYNFRK
jgi:hypothetical protein